MKIEQPRRSRLTRGNAPLSSQAHVSFPATLLAPLLVGLLLGASPVSAQSGAASRAPAAPQRLVIGMVRDSAGAPISNVQVVVTGLNRGALTDDRGEFVLRGIPAGTYHLDAIRIGYAGHHQPFVVPATGGDVRINFVMRIATVRLSSVNVTASPVGGEALQATQASVQLGGKDLQRNISASIGATLAKEPGMAARYSGPLASTPVIRGLTGERVLVLQDGDRAGDLSSAASDHMNAVDPSSAERIEVIRGPASLLYGNNAIGGVVNVISSDIPTTIPGRVSGFMLGQGESGTPGGVGSAGVTIPIGGQFAITARGAFRKFESQRVGGGAIQDNTNGSTNNQTLGAGWSGKSGTVGVVARQMNFEYGLPHRTGEDAVRLDGVRRMAALQSSINTGRTALSSVRVDGTVQSYRHDEIESSGELGTRFSLHTQTANLTARTQLGRASGTFGAQGLFRQYTPAGEEAFTPGADNDNIAAFVYQEIPIGRTMANGHSTQLQLGARYDRFSLSTKPADAADVTRFGAAQTREFDNVAASLGLSVPLAHDVALSGNVSRGFRAPTVEELFANGFHAAVGTFDVGDARITPEQSTGFETGLRAENGGTFAQLNAYYNLIDGYILPRAIGVQDVDGVNIPLVNYIQRDATLYGLEGQVETKLPSSLVGGLMGDFTRARLRDGSGNLPFIPAGRVGGSLRYDNGRISAGGDVRRAFSQAHVSEDPLDVATGAYTLVNISASWLFTARGNTVHSLTLKADNLFDTQYKDATSRIKTFAFNPGRNLSVVYKLLF